MAEFGDKLQEYGEATMTSVRTIERIEAKTLKLPKGTDGCWLWLGGMNDTGYGQIKIDGIFRKVHRIAYEYYYGTIKNRLFVLHHCDTPMCWNPEHLFLGTQRDNMIDMVTKGRHVDNRGENSGHSILTDAEVIEILRILKEEPSYWGKIQDIALRFGISGSVVSEIKHNKTWTHIPRD